MSGIDVRAWVYVVDSGTVAENGSPRRLWVRFDGLGRWLITQHFQARPELYLTVDGRWSERATRETRHTKDDAISLAVDWLERLDR